MSMTISPVFGQNRPEEVVVIKRRRFEAAEAEARSFVNGTSGNAKVSSVKSPKPAIELRFTSPDQLLAFHQGVMAPSTLPKLVKTKSEPIPRAYTKTELAEDRAEKVRVSDFLQIMAYSRVPYRYVLDMEPVRGGKLSGKALKTARKMAIHIVNQVNVPMGVGISYAPRPTVEFLFSNPVNLASFEQILRNPEAAFPRSKDPGTKHSRPRTLEEKKAIKALAADIKEFKFQMRQLKVPHRLVYESHKGVRVLDTQA